MIHATTYIVDRAGSVYPSTAFAFVAHKQRGTHKDSLETADYYLIRLLGAGVGPNITFIVYSSFDQVDRDWNLERILTACQTGARSIQLRPPTEDERASYLKLQER